MATKTKQAPKVDGYQVITDKIVAALEAGTVPWRKPWKSISGFGPTSLSTGKEYRGINQLMLSMQSFAAGYDSIYWGTYRQIEALGGQVDKGQKGTQVVLWKPFEKEVDGKKERYLMMRLFSVFNAEQATWEDGKMPTNPEPTEADYVEPVERAEAILKGMPLRPEIKHGGDRAFYSPLLDYIGMPRPRLSTRPRATTRRCSMSLSTRQATRAASVATGSKPSQASAPRATAARS